MACDYNLSYYPGREQRQTLPQLADNWQLTSQVHGYDRDKIVVVQQKSKGRLQLFAFSFKGFILSTNSDLEIEKVSLVRPGGTTISFHNNNRDGVEFRLVPQTADIVGIQINVPGKLLDDCPNYFCKKKIKDPVNSTVSLEIHTRNANGNFPPIVVVLHLWTVYFHNKDIKQRNESGEDLPPRNNTPPPPKNATGKGKKKGTQQVSPKNSPETARVPKNSFDFQEDYPVPHPQMSYEPSPPIQPQLDNSFQLFTEWGSVAQNFASSAQLSLPPTPPLQPTLQTPPPPVVRCTPPPPIVIPKPDEILKRKREEESVLTDSFPLKSQKKTVSDSPTREELQKRLLEIEENLLSLIAEREQISLILDASEDAEMEEILVEDQQPEPITAASPEPTSCPFVEPTYFKEMFLDSGFESVWEFN